MWIVAVALAGQFNVDVALRGNLPAIGTAHTEVEHRRRNHAAGGDHHRFALYFSAEFAQMLLHYLQVGRLPQSFVFLFMVINHWFEEVNLRLAGYGRRR